MSRGDENVIAIFVVLEVYERYSFDFTFILYEEDSNLNVYVGMSS